MKHSYSGMVQYMDDVIATVVDKLKAKGVWDNTLIVFMSDNGTWMPSFVLKWFKRVIPSSLGGPIYVPGSANNHPLKGGKYSDWYYVRFKI